MRILNKLPHKDILPKGWLRKQLTLQAKGLSGNIAKYFADLSNDSAWLGGSGEAWERGPYYLDGLVPLAFLLNDKELIKKVYQWVDAILSSQNSQVGFGPLRSNDYWPRMVVQKALINFYRATKDNRVIDFLLDYYKFMLKHIDDTPLYFWAAARAMEGMEAMLVVYQLTQDSAILELIEKLRKYGYDWLSCFHNFKYLKPTSKYTNRDIFKLGKAMAEPIDNMIKKSQRIPKTKSAKQIHAFNNMKLVKLISFTHGVNVAMAYKYPVYYGLIKNDKEMMDLAKQGFKRVMENHGLSIGLHSSDEHLMGTDASSGVELCTVVEQLYSFQEALRITKDKFYADMIEYYAFNALPATLTQDMMAHQYVQQPNQIAADRKPRQFFDTNREANIFGVAPNYGCCAANMHQGFPKFAENLVYYDDQGLYFLLYAPCQIKTELFNQKINIKEITEYPFEDSITFEILEANNLNISLRIPKFIKSVYLNGEGIEVEANSIKQITVNSGDKIALNFNNKIEKVSNADGSVSYIRNNLLLAMPLSYKEKYVKGQRPYHDREFQSFDQFNFSPVTKNNQIQIIEEKINMPGEIPFDRNTASIEYKILAKKVLNWKKSYNSAKSPPLNPIFGQDKIISLVPYANTYLRIAQFADFNKGEEND